MTIRQPLKYHGGKFYMADAIISMMPAHKHYVETHFGGGAVLLRKPCDNTSEVANDLDGLLTNFWNVLKDAALFAEFIRLVESTPLSEPQFEISFNAIQNLRKDPLAFNSLFGAYHFFVCMRQSRQGLGKSFTTLSRSRTRRGMQESVSSWLNAVDGLPEVHSRLKRVVIYHKDALAVIREQDSKDTLFYCDPPYLHETRTAKQCYAHEMTAEQHEQLLLALSKIEGRFLLSGYDSQLYKSYARAYGWNVHVFPIKNNASSKMKKEIKNECVWTNY